MLSSWLKLRLEIPGMKSKVIVITGSIATGKSSVSNYLRDKGFKVVDADKIGHFLMEPGQINYQAILEEFGSEILNPDKSINRKRLGQIVFNDQEALNKLNSLTHPNIFNNIRSIADASESDPVFLDIPLYIENLEKGLGRDFKVEQVWLVYLDKQRQIERLMKRNYFNEDEAISRIESQMDIEDKVKYADFIIDNRGTLEDTYKQIDDKLRKICR